MLPVTLPDIESENKNIVFERNSQLFQRIELAIHMN